MCYDIILAKVKYEKKALLKKEKTKEVVKNDSALKSGFSLKDSKNEEKSDFLFKDL